MGFTGTVVVARTTRPLVLRAAMRVFGARTDVDAAGAPGWWVSRLLDCDPAPFWVLRTVASAGGGPLLAADVLDSDVARVRLVAGHRLPATGRFEFLLNTDSAASYGFEVDPDVQQRAAMEILAWLGPDAREAHGPIHDAVRHRSVFAEDGVLRLAASFGAIPLEELSEWLFDDESEPSGG